MSDSWCRNIVWNDEIEKCFFAKLKRARSQRDQYIMTQASSLISNHPDVALRLVDYYFETRKDTFSDLSCLSVKASALIRKGCVDDALDAYCVILKRQKDFPNIDVGATLRYPYLVACHSILNRYDHALRVLEENKVDNNFPLSHFQWHTARALMMDSVEDAKIALSYAEFKKSGYRYHQDLGLVGKEQRVIIKRLRKICRKRWWFL